MAVRSNSGGMWHCCAWIAACALALLPSVGALSGQLASSGGDASWLQVRPWSTFIPSHPDCVHGSCRSFEVTSREALRRMTTPQLNGLLAKTNAQVATLEKEVSQASRQQQASLGALRGRFEAAESANEKHQEEIDQNTTTRTEDLRTQGETIENMEQNASDFSKHAGEELDKLKGQRHKLQTVIWAAQRCGRQCPQLVLAIRSASLLEVVDKDDNPGVDHEMLVRKVEAAEERKAALEKEKQAGLTGHAADQRAFLDRLDALKRKRNVQAAANAQAEHLLAAQGKRQAHQQKAMERYNKRQAASVARLHAGSSALEAQLKGLEAAMKQCGCGATEAF